MPSTFSLLGRRRIARERLEKMLASARPHAEIAERFGISTRTVWRYLRQHRERKTVE